MFNTVHSPSLTAASEGYAHFLADISSIKPTDGCWRFGWIAVNFHELVNKVGEKYNQKLDVSHQEIRAAFIELLIYKTNLDSYGSGSVYELYEERKQETIEHILQYFSFTDEEAALIKKQCDYAENMQPFVTSCECGAELNAVQYAQSVTMMGKECCVNCMIY